MAYTAKRAFWLFQPQSDSKDYQYTFIGESLYYCLYLILEGNQLLNEHQQ